MMEIKVLKQQVHFTKSTELTNFAAIICTTEKMPGSNSCPNFVSSNTIITFSNKGSQR